MALANQQNLLQAIANITLALNTMTVSPKPNYSIDGVSYSWQSLFDSLTEKLKVLRTEVQAEDGPFEVITYGSAQ